MSTTAKHRDKLEVFLYWAMLFSVAVFVTLIILGVIMRPWLPEEVAFVMGVALFYLLANRLFFGYGSLSAYLDKIASGEVTEADKQRAHGKSGAQKHGLIAQLTHYGIATIWLDRYEPYRYTYLAVYLLVAALVVVLNLNFVSGITTGSIVEGFFWGATVVSVFVLAADVLVRWQYALTVVEPVYAQLAPALAGSTEPDARTLEPVCPDPDEPCVKEDMKAMHSSEKH